MMDQVTDYGASLARFIAAQNAAPALGDEWDAVDVAVQEIMKTGDFQQHHGDRPRRRRARRRATPALVGPALQAAPAPRRWASAAAACAVTRYAAGGEPVLGFEAPITFQDKRSAASRSASPSSR